MTTEIATTKGSRLQKIDKAVRDFDGRIERARQACNEKIVRAQSEFVDAVGRAYAAARPDAEPTSDGSTEQTPAAPAPAQ